MFLKEDYIGYFEELERTYGRLVTSYADVMDAIDDRGIRNRLLALTKNNMNAFRFIKATKAQFKKE
jgi:hypothetical protein